VAKGRPSFSFYLIDMPSDHEIDESLVTECQVIKAILHNRNFKSVTKTERITSTERYEGIKWHPYPGLGFVHLAGHASKKGVELIGGTVRWTTVADTLKAIAPKLSKDQKRVLTLSCCYSEYAAGKLTPLLKGHFTGIYFFNAKKVAFADTMTAFAMFYRRKTMRKPHKAIVERINDFFERDVIAFDIV
jgi:hypothetical protein